MKSTMFFAMLFVVVGSFFVGEVKAQEKFQPLDFAFGENDSWVVLYKNSRNQHYYQYRGVIEKAATEMKDSWPKKGRWLRGVGLDGKAGSIIVSENNQRIAVSQKNVFSSISRRIKEITDKGWLIYDVAMTPDQGYVIIYGQTNSTTNGWASGGNIPKGLGDLLNTLSENHGSPVGIGISPSGGWVMVYTHLNCGKWHLRSGGGLPADAAKYIKEKF